MCINPHMHLCICSNACQRFNQRCVGVIRTNQLCSSQSHPAEETVSLQQEGGAERGKRGGGETRKSKSPTGTNGAHRDIRPLLAVVDSDHLLDLFSMK